MAHNVNHIINSFKTVSAPREAFKTVVLCITINVIVRLTILMDENIDARPYPSCTIPLKEMKKVIYMFPDERVERNSVVYST